MLDPLSLVLSRVLDEEGELAELCEGRIANIFLLFSQAENHVKELVADRTVLYRKSLVCHLMFIILTVCRRAERLETDVANASDHDAQIHQEPFHAVDHFRFPAKRKRHRHPDRTFEVEYERTTFSGNI